MDVQARACAQDSTALDAIDRVETLTTGLSRKIWQKLSILLNT